MDTFTEIYESSTGLLKRFNLQPGVYSAFDKFKQEARELNKVVDELSATPTVRELQQLTEETMDVIVTAINVAYSAGVNIVDLIAMAEAVNYKNNSKTAKTHEVVIWPNGAMTIERIGRYPELPKWKSNEQS